jgi:hypothetical protein
MDRSSSYPSLVIWGIVLCPRGLAQGLPDDRQEFSIIHRFLEKGSRSGIESSLLVSKTVASGDDDDGDYREKRNCLEPVHHSEAVACRQTEVEDD